MPTLSPTNNARVAFLDAQRFSLNTGAGDVYDQIAKPGRFEKDGEAITFDRSSLSAFVDNFSKQINHLPGDVEHQLCYVPQNGQPAPLAAKYDTLALVEGGKVVEFHSKGGAQLPDAAQWSDGLYGRRSETTNYGRDLIENKGYGFVSPTFLLDGVNAQGEAVGPQLLTASWVVLPFLDGMQPVTFTRMSSTPAPLVTCSVCGQRFADIDADGQLPTHTGREAVPCPGSEKPAGAVTMGTIKEWQDKVLVQTGPVDSDTVARLLKKAGISWRDSANGKEISGVPIDQVRDALAPISQYWSAMSFPQSGESGLHNAEMVKMAVDINGDEVRRGQFAYYEGSDSWMVDAVSGDSVTITNVHTKQTVTVPASKIESNARWGTATQRDYAPRRMSAAARGKGVMTMATFKPGDKVKVQGDDRVVTVVEEIDDGKQVVIKTDQGQEHILPKKLIVKMSTTGSREPNRYKFPTHAGPGPITVTVTSHSGARRFSTGGNMDPQMMAKLGIAEDASDADKIAALTKYAADMEAKCMAHEEPDGDEDEDEKEIEAMAADLGVEKGPAMMSRIRAAMGAKFVPAVKFAALTAEVESLRAEREREVAAREAVEFGALADQAVAAGYPQEQRDAFVAFARSDRKAAEALIASLPGRRVMGRMTVGGAPVAGARTTSAPVVTATVQGVEMPVKGHAFSQLAKTRAAEKKISLSAAMREIAAERPDLANEALGN